MARRPSLRDPTNYRRLGTLPSQKKKCVDGVTAQSRALVVRVARQLIHRTLMPDYKIKRPFGPPLYQSTVGDSFLSVLKEISEETKSKRISIGNRLAGNVTTQLEAVLLPKHRARFISELHDHIFDALTGFDYDGSKEAILKNATQIKFNLGGGPWINYQLPGDFQPYHGHTGLLSGVIYINVPDVIAKENSSKESNNPTAGKIAFISGNEFYVTSSEYNHQPVTGEILIFPSCLKHQVYPFKSDVERVSMSFNVYDIKVE